MRPRTEIRKRGNRMGEVSGAVRASNFTFVLFLFGRARPLL
jgi:hypothetical protein